MHCQLSIILFKTLTFDLNWVGVNNKVNGNCCQLSNILLNYYKYKTI